MSTIIGLVSTFRLPLQVNELLDISIWESREKVQSARLSWYIINLDNMIPIGSRIFESLIGRKYMRL